MNMPLFDRNTLPVFQGARRLSQQTNGKCTALGRVHAASQFVKTAYPSSAGWKEGTTSKDAAMSIEASGRADKLRDRALYLLTNPRTPKELAEVMGEDITSIRPRLSELLISGQIERTGERRDRQHVLVRI